jgi:hypothetical protein
MSSGLGLKGNVGRCYYFFEDFAGCMKTSEEPIKQCLALRNDYLECLHHKKELIRKVTVEDELSSIKLGKGHGTGGSGH